MGRPRKEFGRKLNEFMVSINPEYVNRCFYRPPSKGLLFPCIVYNISRDFSRFGDNSKYLNMTNYIVTVMDLDPDSEVALKLRDFQYCSFERAYQSLNLNHFVFSIYY